MKRTRALCALIAFALAACGGGPTDTTYTALTGTWEGEVLDGAQVHVRLSLVEGPGGTIGGSGEVRKADGTTEILTISQGTHQATSLSIQGTVGDAVYTTYISGRISPRQDQIDASFGVCGEFDRLWLYRR